MYEKKISRKKKYSVKSRFPIISKGHLVLEFVIDNKKTVTLIHEMPSNLFMTK